MRRSWQLRLFRLAHDWWASDEPADWRAVLACAIGGVMVAPLSALLPALGYDWHVRFYPGEVPSYPPWANVVIEPFRLLPVRGALAVLNGTSLMTIAVATAREAGYARNELWVVLLPLFTAPVLMLLWDGQVDALALLGVLGLPWLVPLALLRPHLVVWPILARRNWAVATAAFLALSLILWGWWPAGVIGGIQYTLGHPISLGWARLGWPIGVIGAILLAFSGRDTYRLMAAGSLAAPYLMPYHFVILLPAIGRVKGWRRILLWACAWLPLLVPALADPAAHYSISVGHYLALIFPLMVWLLLRDTPHSNAQ